MKPLLRQFFSAIHRMGLIPALKAGVRYFGERYREFKLRRWYSKAHASNKRFDLLYGVETNTAIEVDALDVDASKKSESNRFQSIYEELFEEALKYVRIDHSRYSFVDIGAGKGKALLLASRYPFKKIIGVEFSASLCQVCRSNLDAFTSHAQKTKSFEIVCIDARDYEFPSDPTVFFFFNPFNGTLMLKVIENILSSLKNQPRPAWIVYCNPECASYFDTTEHFQPVASGRRFRVWRTDENA